MKITMFATENLYADMDYPFTVTVELEDLETDAQISDASVTIMAEYLGGDNPPWAVNFTAPEEGFPGFYSVTFDHTGAGDYWFTAFCSAAGYEDSSASILRTVNPYRTDPYQPFDISHYHLPFIILSSLAVTFFLVAPLLVHLALKRKDRSQVP